MTASKTEKPTSKKLRDLRDQGQIALSAEMARLAAAVGFMVGVALFGPASWPAIMSFTADAVAGTEQPGNISRVLARIGETVAPVILGSILIASVASVLTTLFQTRFLISFARLQLSTDKLNPVQNLKNLFSLASVLNVLRQITVTAVIMTAILWTERRLLGTQGLWNFCGLSCLRDVLVAVGVPLVLFGTATVLAAGYIDHLLQLRNFTKRNMMSKNDIRDERKQTDGRPEIKSQQRSLRREAAQPDPRRTASEASVLVVNPTHIAVAMVYDEEVDRLPIVTAKYDGLFAQVMKQSAASAGVPIIEHPPLARGLFRDSEVDEEIPSQYLDDVADIFRKVFEGVLAEEDMDGDHSP
jgi:type III secretion protein U